MTFKNLKVIVIYNFREKAGANTYKTNLMSFPQKFFQSYSDVKCIIAAVMYKAHGVKVMHPAGATNAAISSWRPCLHILRSKFGSNILLQEALITIYLLEGRKCVI